MTILTILTVYIAIALTVIVWALMKLAAPTLREEHRDPHERRPIVNEIKKMVGIKKRGSIFIPPSESEEARQRFIEERKKLGLDTPINLLRDEDNEI